MQQQQPRKVPVIVKYRDTEHRSLPARVSWIERRVHSKRTTRFEFNQDTGQEEEASVIEDVFYRVEKMLIGGDGDIEVEIEMLPKKVYYVMSRHVEFSSLA